MFAQLHQPQSSMVFALAAIRAVLNGLA
jgi:hypothetical protein